MSVDQTYTSRDSSPESRTSRILITIYIDKILNINIISININPTKYHFFIGKIPISALEKFVGFSIDFLISMLLLGFTLSPISGIGIKLIKKLNLSNLTKNKAINIGRFFHGLITLISMLSLFSIVNSFVFLITGLQGVFLGIIDIILSFIVFRYYWKAFYEILFYSHFTLWEPIGFDRQAFDKLDWVYRGYPYQR